MHAWKPDIAAEFLRKLDESPDVPHRVTVYFAGIGLGTLRADMEAHAAGRGMSRRLCQEIRAYQVCMLDGNVAEAVHRDVSCQAHWAPSSSMHWWAGGPVLCALSRTSRLRPPRLAGTSCTNTGPSAYYCP